MGGTRLKCTAIYLILDNAPKSLLMKMPDSKTFRVSQSGASILNIIPNTS